MENKGFVEQRENTGRKTSFWALVSLKIVGFIIDFLQIIV